MKRYRLVLGIAFICLLLPLAGPGSVSALTLNGCNLSIGITCQAADRQFKITSVNNDPDDILVGEDYAKISLSVRALQASIDGVSGSNPQPADVLGTDPINDGQDFLYSYSIFDAQFPVVVFRLDLRSSPNLGDVITSGSIPDLDDNSAAPTPGSSFYVGTGSGAGFYTALFLTPNIVAVPGEPSSSDTLFLRSKLSPDLIVGDLTNFDGLFSILELKGPASTITASAVQLVPEPGTLLLLGLGLVGLAAGIRRRHYLNV